MHRIRGFMSLRRVLSAANSVRYRSRHKNQFDGGRAAANQSDKQLETVVPLLKLKAVELGLGPIGITDASPSKRLPEYEEWLEKGRHGEMKYLARSDRLERRRDLSRILPGVESVIVVTLFYWPGKSALGKASNRSEGDVSCYAWGPDYHGILEEKLKVLATWLHKEVGGKGKWYVDTGAIMERDMGARAGLGFTGKNTLLINEKFGSGFFLGEILTTLKLPASAPRKRTGGCGKCTKCIVACPTNAIDSNGYSIDARLCISYLTIELRSSIPEHLRRGVGNKVYGCDICQEVCPWNKFDWVDESKGRSPLFGSPPEEVSRPKLRGIMELSEQQFRDRFKDSAIHRIGLERLKRNAAVALGNLGGTQADADYIETRLRMEDSQLVTEHLRWALNEIRSRLGLVDRKQEA